MSKTILESKVLNTSEEVVHFELLLFISKAGIHQYRINAGHTLISTHQTLREALDAYNQYVEEATQ